MQDSCSGKKEEQLRVRGTKGSGSEKQTQQLIEKGAAEQKAAAKAMLGSSSGSKMQWLRR